MSWRRHPSPTMAQRQTATRRSSGAASARGGGGLTPSAQGSTGAGGGLTPKKLPPGTDPGQVFRLTLPFSMKHMESEGELFWRPNHKADPALSGSRLTRRATRRPPPTPETDTLPYTVPVAGHPPPPIPDVPPRAYQTNLTAAPPPHSPLGPLDPG